ncbi:hypothetical protein JOH51_001594 [Rhizobium leguminosarum]|nr:hypothetical protein [Rhizobium leguminosarum]
MSHSYARRKLDQPHVIKLALSRRPVPRQTSGRTATGTVTVFAFPDTSTSTPMDEIEMVFP